MAPIIHCVRHAQGEHNLSFENHSILDPSLTALGEKQCQTLSEKFPYHSRIDLITASPIRRTVYTALLSFGPVTARGLEVIALPDTQEIADLPCDTGSEVAFLQNEFKDLPVDLHLVEEGWNIKKGKWAPSATAISERARAARQWFKARPEKEAVLVSHGGFLHFFTEDWENSGGATGTGWLNAEYRSYTFADDDSDNATLVETEESRQRRGHSGPVLTKEEQAKIREDTFRTWISWKALKSLDT